MLLAALVACLLTATAGAADGDVYKLIVKASAGQTTAQWVEWVAPDTGRWRIEEADRTYLFTGTSYTVLDRRQGAHVRTGSALFLGTLVDRAVSRDALRNFLAGNLTGLEVKELPDDKTELGFQRGSTRIIATIDEKVPAAAAEERKLFVVPADQITSSSTERPVGVRPGLSIKAYWLGARALGRSAVTAIDYFAGPARDRNGSRASQTNGPVSSHVTFYELPAAAGKSSALPGSRAPAGEVQVLSQPIGSWTAQRAIRAYNGINGTLRYKRWPRTSVTLANAEKVTVIPDRGESTGKTRNGFAVITRTTLVNVTGNFKLNSIPAAARLLRPIP